jgi:hypothetical protein
VLTFDDGYMDNYTDALPCLTEHGFAATVFLVSGAVGAGNTWDSTGALMARPLVGWQEMQQLLSAMGAAAPETRLRRIEIRGTDSMMRFILTLWLGEKGIALPHWHIPNFRRIRPIENPRRKALP